MQQSYSGFEYQLILSALAKGPLTLAQIVETARGLYPSELVDHLQALTLAGKVTKVEVSDTYLLAGPRELAVNDSTTPSHLASQLPPSFLVKGQITPHNVTLPLPHPLDYDWRFRKETTRRLSRLINKTSFARKQGVLLMGAPSLFVELANQDCQLMVTLLDWSKELVRHLTSFDLPSNYRVVEHNLLSGKAWQSEQNIQHIVCDPPWYPEYYRAFLAQGRAC